MFITFVIDLSTKKKNIKTGIHISTKIKNYRPLEIEKSEIPNFSYVCFFRKCSIFCRSIMVAECCHSESIKNLITQFFSFFIHFFVKHMYFLTIYYKTSMNISFKSVFLIAEN